MKFIVERTSAWGDESPCDEAVLEPVQETVTYRTDFVTDPHRYAYDANNVRRAMSPIKTVTYMDGGQEFIRATFEEYRWVVEFKTIDELFSFIKKYERVVIDTEDKCYEYPILEIYDSYRE